MSRDKQPMIDRHWPMMMIGLGGVDVLAVLMSLWLVWKMFQELK